MKTNPAPRTGKTDLSTSAKTGAIALVFLLVGFEAALFIHRAAVTALVAHRDQPDTIYVYTHAESPAQSGEAYAPDGSQVVDADGSPAYIERHSAPHTPGAVRVREQHSPRRVESFRFNPNTASLEEFMRLGFSEKQAQSIINYREAGGRFRRKEDFAKSYVVADSVFERLEPYIDIPKLDINRADSAALTALPGIGPFYAAKIVEYRGKLGGYSYREQLMEIYHFDREKYDGLSDLITCSKPAPYPIWTLPEADLKKHPYIQNSAHGIVLYRQHNPPELLTVAGLLDAGVISPDQATRLSRIVLAAP